MATLKDVAKLANVDVSTVSRALNNTDHNGQPDQRDEQVDSDVFKVKIVCNISFH